MAEGPRHNNLHRYWHKKPPDAPAPAEDSTLGMLSSRLVSFSCCHSPSRSSYVDLLFGSTGAPAEIRLGQLDDVGARAAPPDESTTGILTPPSHLPTGTPLFDLSFVVGPPVDTILEPGGEGISAARGEHLLADGWCRLFCRRRPSSFSLHRSSS